MRDLTSLGTWSARRLPLIVRAATPLATVLVIAVVLTTGAYAMWQVRDRHAPSSTSMLAAFDAASPAIEAGTHRTPTADVAPGGSFSQPSLPSTAPAATKNINHPTSQSTIAALPTDSPAPRSVTKSTATPNARPARPAAANTSRMTYDGRRIAPVRTVTMVVTAYSPDERSCGDSADGITASGYSVWTNGMRMVAADKRVLNFGDLVSVPGYNNNKPVPVLDRGGAIKGNRLDLLMPTHEQAMKWGKRTLQVTVWDYVD